MKSLAVILYILAAAGCSTPQSDHRSPHGRKPATEARRTKSTLVDAKWIEVYRRMEHEHGDYRIKDDDKIVPVGDKFSVPPAVVRNFQDLSNAKQEKVDPSPGKP